MQRASYGYKNLKDLRFGRLTVLNDGKVVNKNRKVPVICDCGNEREVVFQSLIRGTTTSCGCAASELASKRAKINDIRKTLPMGESSRNAILSGYKCKAKQRGLSWNITDEIFFDLIKSNCYYCNSVPISEKKNIYKTGNYKYSGVDRIDNLIGYEKNNVVPCCKVCNFAKNNMSLEDFAEWAIKLVSRIVSWRS